ncbi:MAG: sugar kinase [Bacteroidota bacterium]|nr:sugar kinase [Bacteroidota bacterium]
MVLSFGELLLRMCPDAEGDWLRQNSLPFYVGGAEANVATALAIWGTPSGYATALPENMLSRQLTAYLQQKGIDTSRILYRGERLGLYYLPKGRDLKNAGVIYDRAHSSFSEWAPGSVDWDKWLRDVRWLHFSAISPALNKQLAMVCHELLEAASVKKIMISVDLNYRAKLWQYGAAPIDIMPDLVRHCDLVMGNLWAAEKMLGTPLDTALVREGCAREDYLRHARLTSEMIMERFPRAKFVAKTFRFDRGQGGIHYYTCLFNGSRLYSSMEYFADRIVDKVGSGDCYMAGLIHGLYRGRPLQETLEFATAAAFRKLFIASDATDQTAEEIDAFVRQQEQISKTTKT